MNALWVGGDLGPAALEQGEAELLLKLLNDPCDRGLGTTEHLSCGGDTARRHHRRKRFKLTQIHKDALIKYRDCRSAETAGSRGSKRESLHTSSFYRATPEPSAAPPEVATVKPSGGSKAVTAGNA